VSKKRADNDETDGFARNMGNIFLYRERDGTITILTRKTNTFDIK
jgi:hypothetical protein